MAKELLQGKGLNQSQRTIRQSETYGRSMSLYPTPGSVTNNRGLEGSRSSFSLRWAMYTRR